MMRLKFGCSNCGRVLVTKYLNVGDPAKCGFCGATVVIPDNAERTEDTSSADALVADARGSRASDYKGTSGAPTTSIPESGSGADIMDQLEWADWLHLVWGFGWRGLCISAAAAVSGGVLGLVLGFIAGVVFALIGIPQEQYLLPLQAVALLLGFGLGLLFLIPYIKWLLRARFGSLRLTLIRAG